MRSAIWAVAITVLAGVSCKNEMHKGSSLYTVRVDSKEQLSAWRQLERDLEIDMWEDVTVSRTGAAFIKAHQRDEFLSFARMHNLNHEVKIPDVYEFLEAQDVDRAAARAARNNRILPFPDWPRYAEVDAYLVEVANNFPDIVTLVSAGPSFEGRDIKYLKISTTNFTNTTKPVIYVDAMIHSREWVTVPTAILAIESLVVNLVEEDRDLIENMDWIILPIVNPDGYEFSHTDDRLWRKTRSNVHEGADQCPGVDGNRNFDWYWNTIGVSANPCSDVFPGPSVFSEPETRYVRDILMENLERIAIYMALHSQGNWMLFGYGDGSVPENGVRVHHLAAAMGAAIDIHKLPEARFYVAGNSKELLYDTSGTASDYAQQIGVPFSYTYELPGYGFGHAVPVQYMEHVAFETWQGIKLGARLATIYYQASNN